MTRHGSNSGLLVSLLIAGACAASESDDGIAGGSSTAMASGSASTTAGADGADGADGDDPGDDDSSADDDDPPEDDSGSDDNNNSGGSSSPDPTSDSSSDSGPAPNQIPPMSDAELRPWLAANSYGAWAAESGVHDSAGPHGNGVRTFVNEALFDSLAAGNPIHPIDAAVVKELYDGGVVTGYAVMIKVTDGTGGASWYWYEHIGDSVYADGLDVGLCTGCHEDGRDQVRTPFPLQ